MTVSVLVFIFGGVGCSLRYAINKFLAFQATIPLATLVVNVLGSLVLSYLLFSGEKLNLSPPMRVAITTGMLGGFTTFSTFSLETITLLENGQLSHALLYSLGSLLICVLATWLAITMTRMI